MEVRIGYNNFTVLAYEKVSQESWTSYGKHAFTQQVVRFTANRKVGVTGLVQGETEAGSWVSCAAYWCCNAAGEILEFKRSDWR